MLLSSFSQFAFARFLIEPEDFINNLNMRQQHASATVTFDTQIVQNSACVFSLFDAPGKVFPFVANKETAAETANRNNHERSTYRCAVSHNVEQQLNFVVSLSLSIWLILWHFLVSEIA
jgi:hypothetical protein